MHPGSAPIAARRPAQRRVAVKARRNAFGALGRQLKADGIEVVTLESTPDYWRIWFFVLEACGLVVQLVNAAQARNLPGRPKTDKLDAQWLAGATPGAPVLNAVPRLAEIPGVSPELARTIIAETGLDMSRFPTAVHLVSWAGLCPSARQSGTRTRAGKKGQGNGFLRGSLGQAATGAARTATFLGERYHRIARRRGKAKAQIAVARSILVIIWHLLADPAARYTDLGPGYYQARTDTDRKLRNHMRQIETLLGHPITITPKAA